MTQSFLWYDYETFGSDPRRCRPAQFAAIRTDAELNEVGAPLVLYCRPPLDALPAEFETPYLRHVHFDAPVVACVDGRAGKAVVKLPGAEA